MFCNDCGTAFEGQACPSCGTRSGAALSGSTASAFPAAAVASPVVLRCCGYLIDMVPAMLVGILLGLVPVAGPMLTGIVLIAYWLLRDINGASPAKMLLGLRVVSKGGGESSAQERILRNVTLIVGPVFLLIPLAGVVVGPLITCGTLVLELFFLITRKERLGDMLAGTAVVRK